MTKRHFILIISTVFILQSCSWLKFLSPAVTPAKAIEIANNLISSINAFITLINSFQNEYNQKILDKKRDLSSSKISRESLKVILENWNEDGKYLSKISEQLKQKLEAINMQSKEYWDALYKVANEIENENLKQKELNEIKVLKDKWQNKYKMVEDQVNNINQLNSRTRDFERLITIAILKVGVEQLINELDKISNESNAYTDIIKKILKEQQSIITNTSQIILAISPSSKSTDIKLFM